MTRRKPPHVRSVTPEELERVEATQAALGTSRPSQGLDKLRAELVVGGRTRSVEDVQALPLASKEELDRVLPRPKKKIQNRGRERRAQLRQDEIGAPCACSPDGTPCLAHYSITGRRRFLRPD
jgi:hypothetical protein